MTRTIAGDLRVTQLTVDETIALRDSWRRVYARPLKRTHGVWHRGKYDWHIFSQRDTYALEREEARAAYHAQLCNELLVIPNDKHRAGYRVVTHEPVVPDEEDVYIFPPDLAWTMVFTHEDGWLGPYFSKATWVDGPPAKVEMKPSKSKGKGKGKRRK
ncbi:MAG: DUF4275 family protein [Polyangiaceae bacterium]